MPLYAAHDGERVYQRDLPSGGYIAIEATEVSPLFAPPKIRGHVVVERRSQERRVGHRPPLAAIAERDSLADIMTALLPIAENDGAIAEVLSRRVTIPVTRRRELPET